MSSVLPPKRRATYSREMSEGLTRTTRSMARLSDWSNRADQSQESSTQAQGSRLATAASSASRLSSRTRYTARLQSFEPDSPETRPVAHMDSPKKGRFDDFEFEVEDTEAPVRRGRLGNRSSLESAQAPPSYESVVEVTTRPFLSSTLTTSRKENTSTPQRDNAAKTNDPIKPAVAPRVSRLTAASASSTKAELSEYAEPMKQPFRPRVDAQQSTKPGIPTRQLTFTASHSPMKRDPFATPTDPNGLARMGESRHSPVKRMQIKPEMVLQSPVRSGSRPINLLDLKPSPGKAQRGIFRHNLAEDDSLEDKGEDEEDEKLVAVSAHPRPTAVSASSISIPARSTSTKNLEYRSTAAARVKVMSAETKGALASLEASLSRLTSKPQARTNSSMTGHDVTASHEVPRRVLGGASSSMTSSRTQIFPPAKGSGLVDSSDASRSSDSSEPLFKKPVGRVSALSKSRRSSIQLHSLASNPVSLEQSAVPRAENAAATEATRVAGDEARRRAALQAARRKSTQSILSAGMPPPMIRRPVNTTQENAPASDSGHAVPASADAEARKEAREARRRSLYTYVPTKREASDVGDRSVGNVSASLVISAPGPTIDADGSVQTVRRTRFLRGLTVLVDVRDQDGEDASARWVEMLKTAGAKVMVRFGERQLSHIVYKSGRPSTLHSYRALPEPKPIVVGIGWVAKCLEEGKRVEEEPYLIEVAKQAIFTGRQLSMAPKQAPPREPFIDEKKQEELEQKRLQLLAHAPLVSSPLRKRLSTRTLTRSALSTCEVSGSFAKMGLAETSDRAP